MVDTSNDHRIQCPGYYVTNHCTDPNHMNGPPEEPIVNQVPFHNSPPWRPVTNLSPTTLSPALKSENKPPDENLKNKFFSVWNNMRHGKFLC